MTRIIPRRGLSTSTQAMGLSATRMLPAGPGKPSKRRDTVSVRALDERTPLYMGLITLSSAMAAVTQLWAGVATFGLMVLVYEGLNRWFFRLSR